MRKKRNFNVYLYFVFFLVVLFLWTNEVSAAREICSSKALSEAKAKINKVNLEYELRYDEHGSHYYSVMVSNLSEGIEFNYGGVTYTYKKELPIQTLLPMFDGDNSVEIDFYPSYGKACVGEKIGTKKLTIPKYNKYSEYNACIEYEEFPLCGKHYSGEIESINYFYEKLDDYKKSLEKKEDIVEKEKEKNFFEKFIDIYMENLIITIPLTAVFGGTIVYLIVKKVRVKKKRVKIKL